MTNGLYITGQSGRHDLRLTRAPHRLLSWRFIVLALLYGVLIIFDPEIDRVDVFMSDPSRRMNGVTATDM